MPADHVRLSWAAAAKRNKLYVKQTLSSNRFLNGYNSVLNVTVADESYGTILSNDMSEYVLVKQGE